MELNELIDALERHIKDPSAGLPEDVFLFITRITPMINVDLLIKNADNHTLLTWREDGLYPPSWHVPGGIIRYKEKMLNRIHAVAAKELGAKVDFKEPPLAVSEVLQPTRRVRGHFISILYSCTLISPLDERLKYVHGEPKNGQWAWHERCPDNLISVHEMYRKFI